jgi:hypothetical protein
VPAKNVTASVLVAPEDQRTISPDRAGWTALNPSPEAAVAQNQLEADDELFFGPFRWRPTSASRYSILALIDANGDYSNLNPTTGLPCAVNTIPLPLEAVVPLDNNIGLRTLAVT